MEHGLRDARPLHIASQRQGSSVDGSMSLAAQVALCRPVSTGKPLLGAAGCRNGDLPCCRPRAVGHHGTCRPSLANLKERAAIVAVAEAIVGVIGARGRGGFAAQQDASEAVSVVKKMI